MRMAEPAQACAAPPPPEGVLCAGAHYFPLRVYFEDTDAGGVVYHATYLRFAERARTEMLRALGQPHARLIAEGAVFVVRALSVRYLRPARLDDALLVRTRVLRLGGASVELAQDVLRAEAPGAAGETLAALAVDLACADRARGTPVRLPAAWRHAFAPFLGEAAGGKAGSGA